jgi:hypothetical protein
MMLMMEMMRANSHLWMTSEKVFPLKVFIPYLWEMGLIRILVGAGCLMTTVGTEDTTDRNGFSFIETTISATNVHLASYGDYDLKGFRWIK